MADVLAAAVEQCRRRRFIEDLNADFAALRSNTEEWKLEQDEQALWDVSVDDGSQEAK